MSTYASEMAVDHQWCSVLERQDSVLLTHRYNQNKSQKYFNQFEREFVMLFRLPTTRDMGISAADVKAQKESSWHHNALCLEFTHRRIYDFLELFRLIKVIHP